jgi:hypothetical protein
MVQRIYPFIAGVIFLLIAVGHVLRLIFGASFIVHDVAIPMWASFAAAIVTGFLAYEGFHVMRKSTPRT